MSEWVLFRKSDGRIGILPSKHKNIVKGVIIETMSGTFADACDRCLEIERSERGD